MKRGAPRSFGRQRQRSDCTACAAVFTRAHNANEAITPRTCGSAGFSSVSLFSLPFVSSCCAVTCGRGWWTRCRCTQDKVYVVWHACRSSVPFSHDAEGLAYDVLKETKRRRTPHTLCFLSLSLSSQSCTQTVEAWLHVLYISLSRHVVDAHRDCASLGFRRERDA